MRLTLLGDTMLGRGVAERLVEAGPASLWSSELVEVVREADLVVANLECCISERGRPADKMFVFRAPPIAAEALARLGVHAVTLANNHSLDFGPDALADTLVHLDSAGIGRLGAGLDLAEARRPLVLEGQGVRLGLVAFTDHPREFAAGPASAGVAFVDLGPGALPGWVRDALASVEADAVVVTPHWGPNMVTEPLPEVRRAAALLRDLGAGLVAGHSAHVFHGFAPHVLYDLGDFVDDYARDPLLRNDLGIITSVELSASGTLGVEVVPIKLDYCHTALARGADAAWVRDRLQRASAALGVEVVERDGRLVASW